MRDRYHGAGVRDRFRHCRRPGLDASTKTYAMMSISTKEQEMPKLATRHESYLAIIAMAAIHDTMAMYLIGGMATVLIGDLKEDFPDLSSEDLEKIERLVRHRSLSVDPEVYRDAYQRIAKRAEDR